MKDRGRRHYEHAAAAHLLRMPDLAQAIVLLNDARLFAESATLVRVAAELAITAQWVGTNDEKAFWLALDSADAAERGDNLRKEHFGIDTDREPIDGAKRLPPLPNRAKEAGQDAEAFYAGTTSGDPVQRTGRCRSLAIWRTTNATSTAGGSQGSRFSRSTG